MDSGLEVNRWVAVKLETQERNSEGETLLVPRRGRQNGRLHNPATSEKITVLIKEIHPSLKKGSVRGAERETGNPAAMPMRGISEVIITEMNEG